MHSVRSNNLNIYTLLVCLGIFWLFVSNNRLNGWTNPAQILCGTSHNAREGLWMIKIKTISSNKIRLPLNFINLQKLFLQNLRTFCLFLVYNVYKEKMFTIEKKDGPEAPWKPGNLSFKYLVERNKKIIL